MPGVNLPKCLSLFSFALRCDREKAAGTDQTPVAKVCIQDRVFQVPRRWPVLCEAKA